MVSAACMLLLLVAAIGHCDESHMEYFRNTVILARDVSNSFGDEMVMYHDDGADGSHMTLREALTKILNITELEKYIADTTNNVKLGFKCRVLKYTALAAKLGKRTLDTAMVYSGDTQIYVVAYAKAMALTVANTAAQLVTQFYETTAVAVAKETDVNLTAIDPAQTVVANDVIKEGAKATINSSVTVAAEKAATDATLKISGIFNRTDGSLETAMKEFTDLKEVNVLTFNTKIDELIANMESMTGGDNDQSTLLRDTVDNIPATVFDIAMRISGTVYSEVAERALQLLKTALEDASAYLPDGDREKMTVLIAELGEALPLITTDPENAIAVLTKLFDWTIGEIQNGCTKATDYETLYGALANPDIVNDAFSDSQLTANCLLDKEVCVVDNLKADFSNFPETWKVAE